jgi:hypothetical protein
MTTINDGGPAFPMSYAGSEVYTYPNQQGMTLRDWFAGQALVSMGVEYTDECHASVAQCAYRYADAMLRAREVKP